MADQQQTFKQRFEEYQVSKTALFWSCAACIALTLILGFTWGGWVTGGTATEMAESAAQDAQAELAASVCVERFMHATDAGTQLAALKDVNSWEREDFISEGGWATLAGMEEPVIDAADICAERLMEAKLPAATPAAAATTTSG